MMNRPIPLRPDYGAAASSKTKSFFRAATAHVIGTLNKEDPTKIVEQHWRDDVVAKAATAPANSTTSGLAADLVAPGVGSPVLLTPSSASARLSQLCVRPNFSGVGTVLFPNLPTAGWPTGEWVAEGSSASMVAPSFGGILIGPLKKVLIGAAITTEIRKYAIETAVQVIEQALTNAATLTIDSALLDAVVSDTERPGGLLHNVTPIAATSAGGLAALVTDLGKIADAMATAKIPAENLVLITSPAAAIRMRALLNPAFPYVIIGSIAVAATTLIGVAPSAIAMFVGPPEIEAANAPVVILDTAARDNIDTTTVSTQTVRSAYQCDLIVLKCRIRAAWGPLVTSGAVQVINSVTW